jgi:hypothetical protein
MPASFSIYKDIACAPSEYFIWTVEFEGIPPEKLAWRISRALGRSVLRPFAPRLQGLSYACGHFAAEHVMSALLADRFVLAAPAPELQERRAYYQSGQMHSAPAPPSPFPGALATPGALELTLFVQFSRHCALASKGAFSAETDPFLRALASWPPAKASALADFETLADSCDPHFMRPAFLALDAARASLAARHR